MIPRHQNPPKANGVATAPYNFVPLPERVYCVADGVDIGGQKVKPWERHDEFLAGANHGWIDLEICTLTPLFIRGPVTQNEEGIWDRRDVRLRPDPFLTPEGTPLIPGSSLRGMVRTLVEILSFAKIQPVSNRKPCFRTVSKDRLGDEYRQRVLGVEQKTGGGFLQRAEGGWSIAPCEVVRVRRELLERKQLKFGQGSTYTPDWLYQHRKCWVDLSSKSIVRDIEFEEPKKDGWIPGILVLTGNAPKKKSEFVFRLDTRNPSPIPIPEEIWERFHDDDQITQWQEKAFPVDKPDEGSRQMAGGLRVKEPVFYVVDESKKSDANPEGLVFLGRAQMFRFPYDLSPADLVPDFIRNAGLDLAEAMFGKVGQDKQAIKGRVFFEDAIAVEGEPPWLEDVIVPRILSSPKVTTFQHYLTQNGDPGKSRLTTYLKGDRTTIRGHKLYWHRWDCKQGLAAVKEPSEQHERLLQDLSKDIPEDSQHTRIRPVKAKVVFRGRVRFENLSDVELGALLSALELPEGCGHRLGMGKPLGLGSVQIAAKLHLIDRSRRYASWAEMGVTCDDGTRFRNAFYQEILKHAQRTGEIFIHENSGLRRIARLDALFLLLEWKHHKDTDKTAYMELEKFKSRLVLPTPHFVAGKQEPTLPREVIPEAGEPPAPPKKSDALPDRSQTQVHAPGVLSIRSPHEPKVKNVQKGQTQIGTLHRDEGNQWFAKFEGDERRAVITNTRRIPPDVNEGAKAQFYIEEQSKKKGIKARFDKLLD
ncbi:MAG: TIGR03986 family CRISPR-associated RAMP protein [Bryobacteraceae bacterium]|nr:TIGR03986 family CRISPR-associated RAMP protein [Bryobacteraceae bacterium]MDW8380471.1 TIGR03986 family CRISPR-associated RAMP protein [Bryobacterales bacterium]